MMVLSAGRCHVACRERVKGYIHILPLSISRDGYSYKTHCEKHYGGRKATKLDTSQTFIFLNKGLDLNECD